MVWWVEHTTSSPLPPLQRLRPLVCLPGCCGDCSDEERREVPGGFCREEKKSCCSCLARAAVLCDKFLPKSEKHYSGIEICLKKKKKARVLSFESLTWKRLWFFSLNYNDIILHFTFFDLKKLKNRLHTFPNRNCRFCVKFKCIPSAINLIELAGYSLLPALLSDGPESFHLRCVLSTPFCLFCIC